MTEQTPVGELEKKLGAHPSGYDVAQREVLHKTSDDYPSVSSKTPEMAGEDFLDPLHPQYGQVDEHGRRLPGWLEQITPRAIILAAGLGFVFNLMVLKLGFTVGIIPSLNIAAGLIGFTGIKAWVAFMTSFLHYFGHLPGFGWMKRMQLDKPFTRQENTVIQTTVVACYGLAFSGGFTNSLLAMDWNSYLRAEGGNIAYPDGNIPATAYSRDAPPNTANVVQPGIGKYIAFMAVIYFVGIFVLVPLRRLFIIKYRLTYPSGTATGTIINGFHTPLGEATAKKQVLKLGKWFSLSFIYSGIKWCFSGVGDSCGMDNLPTFGKKAQFWTWYEPFSQTYIGIGLLVPKHITYGIVAGAVLTYGIMWPLINNHTAGNWFPAKYSQPSNNIRGIYAYKVFVGLGFILGDGAYNIIKLFATTAIDMYRRRNVLDEEPMTPETFAQLTKEQQYQRKLQDLRDYVFTKGQMPWKWAVAIYIALAGISIGVTPQLFPGTKAYYVLIAYIIAPVLGFCNAYGAGLSDWSLLTTYGKLCIVIFAAWGGPNGGIIGGLAVCTVMQTIVGMCSDLMQDFRTGHLTLASPRSMLAAQTIGAALAVVISPAAFWLYWSGFDIGAPTGEYKAPFAPVFRNIAVVAVNGSKDLPKHCLAIAGGAFGLAILMDISREILGRTCKNPIWVKLIPIPSMLGIPSFIGGYFTVDMTIGAVILGIWQYFAPADALLSAPLVASALIAGDGVFSVPSAIFALAKLQPPYCAQFFRTNYYEENIASLVDS